MVNDGEMGRFAFANYIIDRFTGFEGEGRFPRWADLRDHPDFVGRRPPGSKRALRTPSCTGPVTYKDPEAIQRDIANFTAALQGVQSADTFMTAPSPGEQLEEVLEEWILFRVYKNLSLPVVDGIELTINEVA